jgi:hypothetical protein
MKDEPNARPSESVNDGIICLEERPLELRARIRHAVDALDQCEISLSTHHPTHLVVGIESFGRTADRYGESRVLRVARGFESEQARGLDRSSIDLAFARTQVLHTRASFFQVSIYTSLP